MLVYIMCFLIFSISPGNSQIKQNPISESIYISVEKTRTKNKQEVDLRPQEMAAQETPSPLRCQEAGCSYRTPQGATEPALLRHLLQEHSRKEHAPAPAPAMATLKMICKGLMGCSMDDSF